jgi:micrococcal nuclease
VSTRRPLEFQAFPAALAAVCQFGPYRGIVRHVTDGDTLDVLLDLGFQSYTYVTVRVRGVNAPERNTSGGKAAQAYVRQLLPPGTPVALVSHQDPQTFGRYVAEVRLDRDGSVVDLGTHLVDAGHAVRSVWA